MESTCGDLTVGVPSGLPGACLLYENVLVLRVAGDQLAFPAFVRHDELKPA